MEKKNKNFENVRNGSLKNYEKKRMEKKRTHPSLTNIQCQGHSLKKRNIEVIGFSTILTSLLLNVCNLCVSILLKRLIKSERERLFATTSDFLIPISLDSDVVNL